MVWGKFIADFNTLGDEVKKYQIIYADPPWHFGSGCVYQDGGRPVRKIEDQYLTTKTKDLKQIPVQDICDKDCLLFMWVIDSHIPDALELIKAWGFKYSTVAFYWVKKYNTGSNCYNVGRWTMKTVEPVFLASMGTPMHFKKKSNVKQLIEAVRTKHSKKPNEVKDRIVELCGDLPRIELFARQKTEGWDVWGNEVESDIDLTGGSHD